MRGGEEEEKVLGREGGEDGGKDFGVGEEWKVPLERTDIRSECGIGTGGRVHSCDYEVVFAGVGIVTCDYRGCSGFVGKDGRSGLKGEGLRRTFEWWWLYSLVHHGVV